MVRGFIYDGFYTTDDFNYVNGQYILKEGVADLGSFINPVHGVDRPSGQNAYPVFRNLGIWIIVAALMRKMLPLLVI